MKKKHVKIFSTPCFLFVMFSIKILSHSLIYRYRRSKVIGDVTNQATNGIFNTNSCYPCASITV